MSRPIGPVLRRRWRQLAALPGGRRLFSLLVGRAAPYTGSIGARVEALAPGYCRVAMKDRRAVRNHLRSIHAIALCNLGEMATGLALMNGLPAGARGILVAIRADYHHKARGTLRAECRCDVPPDDRERRCELAASITDAAGQTVATVVATWLIGPDEEPRAPGAD